MRPYSGRQQHNYDDQFAPWNVYCDTEKLVDTDRTDALTVSMEVKAGINRRCPISD